MSGRRPHRPPADTASQDTNSSKSPVHVGAQLPISVVKASNTPTLRLALLLGTPDGHYGSSKQEKRKLSTSYSLFNVTVLTGLLHGLLFTAFTITR